MKRLPIALSLISSSLNAQVESHQIRDWNITPDIIRVFGMGIRDSQGGAGQYRDHLHTKQIVCGTDTVTISAIGYSNRPGIEVKETPDALYNFGREIDGNPDVKKILLTLLRLKSELKQGEENTNVFHYCPQAL